jgi:hypothetical protein
MMTWSCYGRARSRSWSFSTSSLMPELGGEEFPRAILRDRQLRQHQCHRLCHRNGPPAVACAAAALATVSRPGGHRQAIQRCRFGAICPAHSYHAREMISWQEMHCDERCRACSGCCLKARLQLLQRQVSAGKSLSADAWGVIFHDMGSMERLIADLRVSESLDTGHFTLVLEPCDLVALCREAVEAAQLATGRVVSLILPETSVVATVDYDRIGQVLTNLLSNALKYSPADQAVELTLVIEEAPNHSGIDSKHEPKLAVRTRCATEGKVSRWRQGHTCLSHTTGCRGPKQSRAAVCDVGWAWDSILPLSSFCDIAGASARECVGGGLHVLVQHTSGADRGVKPRPCTWLGAHARNYAGTKLRVFMRRKAALALGAVMTLCRTLGVSPG